MRAAYLVPAHFPSKKTPNHTFLIIYFSFTVIKSCLSSLFPPILFLSLNYSIGSSCIAFALSNFCRGGRSTCMFHSPAPLYYPPSVFGRSMLTRHLLRESEENHNKSLCDYSMFRPRLGKSFYR